MDEQHESALQRAWRREMDATVENMLRAMEPSQEMRERWRKEMERRAALTWFGRAREDAARWVRDVRWQAWDRLDHAWRALRGQPCGRWN